MGTQITIVIALLLTLKGAIQLASDKISLLSLRAITIWDRPFKINKISEVLKKRENESWRWVHKPSPLAISLQYGSL